MSSQHRKKVRRGVIWSLDHFAVGTQDRLTQFVELRHVRSMHFREYFVHRIAESQGGAVHHVQQVPDRIGDRDDVIRSQRLPKLCRFLFDQTAPQLLGLLRDVQGWVLIE